MRGYGSDQACPLGETWVMGDSLFRNTATTDLYCYCLDRIENPVCNSVHLAITLHISSQKNHCFMKNCMEIGWLG
jgi:hypothetical protein